MESLSCLYGAATGVLLTLMAYFIKRSIAEIRAARSRSVRHRYPVDEPASPEEEMMHVGLAYYSMQDDAGDHG